MNRLHYKFATLAILALSASFPAAMAVSYDNTANQSSPSQIAAASAEPQTKEEKKEEKKDKEARKKDNKDDKKDKPDLGADKNPAPCRSWIDPRTKPKVALLCIHGLGLNSDSYTNFGVRMSNKGIATYAIDVRGFGSWMKAKGNEDVDFDQCLEDVRATLMAIRTSNPGTPVFLLGESMGGAIALRACSMFPEIIDGLISSVPSGERFQQKKTDLKVALEFLKGRHKQHDIGTQIINQATVGMPEENEDWASDPLDRLDLSAEQLIQFQKFMNDNHDAAKLITKTPTLMLQGTLDTLVKPEGTWEIFNEIASRQKTFVALPSEHLIIEEGQAKSSQYDNKTAQMVSGWMFSNAPDMVPVNANVTTTSSAASQSRTQNSSAAETTAATNQSSTTTTSQGSSTIVSAHQLPTYQTGNKPTVLVFRDAWSAQCQSLDPLLAQAQRMCGKPVAVKSIDISDPTNAALVTNYYVAPIPTFIFFKSNGAVDSTLIGRCVADNIAEGMKAAAGVH